MSDFDFIIHKEPDFRYHYGSQKDNVHHGRKNPHPLPLEVREAQRKAFGKLRACCVNSTAPKKEIEITPAMIEYVSGLLGDGMSSESSEQSVRRLLQRVFQYADLPVSDLQSASVTCRSRQLMH